MKTYIKKNFLLHSSAAERLYHEVATQLPIIDYHNHLSAADIAADRQYENLTQIWLEGDHYKWRAMRANGVEEKYISGESTEFEKFTKWAETVPFTLRNPLYHWTHMELLNPFGIKEMLNGSSAWSIYDECNKKLKEESFSARNLLRRRLVEVVCTTNDPTEQLVHHKRVNDEGLEFKVLPTFRPDKALQIESTSAYVEYIERLGETANVSITTFDNLLEALKKRHDEFHNAGCRLSDHGIGEFKFELIGFNELNTIFNKALAKKPLTLQEKSAFRCTLLSELALMDTAKGWTQQLHIGVIRNNNSFMFDQIGKDTGFDSMGDWSVVHDLSQYFDGLYRKDSLPKTVLYNANPKDSAALATLLGNFNDSSTPGKMQLGPAWWFLDQKDGIEEHIKTVSNFGLLTRFVGMQTDSRSILSYSRHEYFRRIVCNILGEDVDKGLLPADFTLLSRMVKRICYENAANYFGFFEEQY